MRGEPDGYVPIRIGIRDGFRAWRDRFAWYQRPCPTCGHPLTYSQLNGYDAGAPYLKEIECIQCVSTVHIKIPALLQVLYLILFFPFFLVSIVIMHDVLTSMEWSRYWHEARGYWEPRFLPSFVFMTLWMVFMFQLIGLVAFRVRRLRKVK